MGTLSILAIVKSTYQLQKVGNLILKMRSYNDVCCGSRVMSKKIHPEPETRSKLHINRYKFQLIVNTNGQVFGRWLLPVVPCHQTKWSDVTLCTFSISYSFISSTNTAGWPQRSPNISAHLILHGPENCQNSCSDSTKKHQRWRSFQKNSWIRNIYSIQNRKEGERERKRENFYIYSCQF